MPAPLHINTTVNGSVAMCRDAAAALREGAGDAESATDRFHDARDHARSGWIGPASQAFLDHLRPHAQLSEDLAKSCAVYGDAVEEFAGMLDSVYNDMDKVLGMARTGGLEVDGPIVMRPDHPGPAPRPSADVLHNGEASAAYAAYRRASDAYGVAAADYNARVAVFNECLAIYKTARNREKQAHTDLWEALRAGKGYDLDGDWNVGTTTASALVGLISTGENQRTHAWEKASQKATIARPYMELAAGRLPSNMTQLQRDRFFQHAINYEGERRAYTKRFQQLDRTIGRLPEGMREVAVAHPGSALRNGPVKSALSKAPLVGGGIVAYAELKGAATGEQTWGRAVARTGGGLGGAALGGGIGVAGCAWGTPLLQVVCGAGGGMLGGFLGVETVDWFVPGEDAEFPSSAPPVPYAPGWEGR